MVERVSHEGTVVKVEGNDVFVRIVQTSACASCSLSRHCNSAESKEKTVVAQAGADSFRVGESVLVSVSSSLGHKAVSLGFGVPLVLLLAVVVAANGLTSETAVSLAGTGSVDSLTSTHAIIHNSTRTMLTTAVASHYGHHRVGVGYCHTEQVSNLPHDGRTANGTCQAVDAAKVGTLTESIRSTAFPS